MKLFHSIATRAVPLGLILLLLSGMSGPDGSPLQASPSASDQQSPLPRIAHVDLYAPAALLPRTSRPPSVAENRTPGQTQSEKPSGKWSSPAASTHSSHPPSQHAFIAAAEQGILDRTCPLLCVFRY